MKTKIILFDIELRDDLTYAKYCEFPTYKLKENPETFDVEREYSSMRETTISQSVDGKIISTSSKIIYDDTNFSPIEEITINYQ
jgi:hypothetical protein